MARAVTAAGRLEPGAPYPVGPVLRWLAAHAVPGLEVCDVAARRHRRAVGPAAVIEVDFADPRALRVDIDADPRQRPGIERAVRGWLDIDAPTAEIDARLARSPVLAPLVAARPGLRVLGALDGFETAVMTILGQHVSVAAARRFGTRLVERYGSDGRGGLRAFPSPAVLAAAAPDQVQQAVGVTHARARSLHALAARVAAGELDLAPGADSAAARAALLALPGIGPWTADYLALRVFRDADAFPADDLVIKRAVGAARAADARAAAESWRPYRAYAAVHLWTALAFA